MRVETAVLGGNTRRLESLGNGGSDAPAQA